jgi:hypothetical protein
VGMMRLLLKMLISENKYNEKVLTELEKALQDIGLKLPGSSQKNPSKKYTIEDKIRKARFQRTDFIKILENQEKILEILNFSNYEKQKEEVYNYIDYLLIN